MSFKDFLANSKQHTAAAASIVSAPARTRRLLPSVPYVNKLPLFRSLPRSTREWCRSAADERAAIEFGCRFSEIRGQYVVDWKEKNCILYEGDMAGSPMQVDDWQYEATMQTYGWLVFDEDWAARRPSVPDFGWIRRYRVVSGWVPKKNAKSPTLASDGLYNFAGDGEQGQKCFSLATTRDQALIAHTHAVNFVRQSTTLSTRCKIDATTLTISDSWSNSTYSILCGDKGSLKVSKEGINGSLFIDETHVVDDAFMSVVSRAGISRRQPLRVQKSTSGNNTAGYGYGQYILGQENLRAADEGRHFDWRYLHYEYSIPQTTSIDDLRNPDLIDGFITQSNPTLGRIVIRSEAKADWTASCRSDTELAKFAMYRLNLWLTGAGAFIAGSDWNRCGRRFSLDEVREHPCIIGVDLSRSRDMTSVVICWAVPKTVLLPEDPFDPYSEMVEREVNVPYVKPFFWAPKRGLSQFTGKFNWELLQERKQLFVTEGPIVRAEAIAEHINYLDERFDVRGVATDNYGSTKLAAALAGNHGWDIEGANSRFFLVLQPANHISPAIEQLIGCVVGQELVHDCNEVMQWQLGNVTLIENTDGERKIQKPKPNDWRKIDGWAALTNAIYAMMNDPDLFPGQTYSIKLTS